MKDETRKSFPDSDTPELMKLPALGLDIFKILIFPTVLQITNRLYIYM